MLKEAYTKLEEILKEDPGKTVIGSIFVGQTAGGALAYGIDYLATGTANANAALMVGMPAAFGEMVGVICLGYGIVMTAEMAYFIKDKVKEHYKPTPSEA